MKIQIKENEQCGMSFEEAYSAFIMDKTSYGVSDSTLKNYHNIFKTFKKYLDVSSPISELSKRELNGMVVAMRKAKLAQNSIATYTRMMKTFLTWCNNEGYSDLHWHNVKEIETVKEIYTDAELEKLLVKPSSSSSFCEYRNWVIICFFLNSGCRASTLRHIQNKDIDLDHRQVVFRHTKTKRIQVNPLCSQMVIILREYINIRKGMSENYLFCDQYGDQLSENALRLAVAHYNKSRGVKRTSIHAFRHTFAHKYLVDGNGDAFSLQKLLGHTTLRTTKHYCQIFNKDLADKYDEKSPLAQLIRQRHRIQR